MPENHLTADTTEHYIENEIEERDRAAIELHLGVCKDCRDRLARARKIDLALAALPRQNPPRDLTARINSTVESWVAEEQARRGKLPLIAVSAILSAVLALWFAFTMVVAIQANGALDFLSAYTSIDMPNSGDALLAFVEALPFSEIGLTIFALAMAIVMAQQLVETLRPRTLQLK